MDGHTGLSNTKVGEATNGEFFGALSSLKATQHQSFFVMHVYSNTFDFSPYLQRSNARSTPPSTIREKRQNFLERIGLTFTDSCNILHEGRCYYLVMEEILPEEDSDELESMQRVRLTHDSFMKFMAEIQEIYEGMVNVDRMLIDAGIELPWSNIKHAPIVYDKREKVYEKGQVYDFYKDIKDITQLAKNEVFLVDAYPDEEVLDLYLEKVPTGIRIRILTNAPKGKFVTVAQKFKVKPGVNFEVRSSSDCHDRFFFIDGECWVMGQSLKDAAKKPTYLIKVESSALFKKVFDDLWSHSKILI